MTSPAYVPPRTRDQVLAEDVRDLLRHDARVAGLAVEVEVDGGVVHARGHVPGEALRTLQTLLRRANGVRAAWDLLAADGHPPVVLDLGCGAKKQRDEAIGIDAATGAADVLADLERPLPLRADSADHVFAVHVLEHIHALPALMDELHRVVRPGGVLHVLAPNWRFVNAVADPTHCRLIDPQTFKYWCVPARAQRWRPLAVSASAETVFVDLQPIKDDASSADAAAVARWFD